MCAKLLIHAEMGSVVAASEDVKKGGTTADGAPASSRPDRRLPGGRQDAGGPVGWKPALRWAIGGIALLLMADVPYEMTFGASSPQLRAKLIFIAMLMLYGACVWMLWRGRGRVPTSSDADSGALPAEPAHN